ncbi:lipopolysaccharide biosynthesis protein [Hydrogenophaga palleronii]|uniref:lipopolysaccharide biosynthesis protein n=1 Tax=Hydrogenophaga palleronii TaxID=65655 RepID=UPI0008243223|nr:oligosaccharide flippase family protein [Hydrogenophaga palleronii]
MSFLRSVAVLVGGTAMAHGITAIALPILSRLYTPSEFSLLAVFAGLVAIVSVAACLRFDVAIALPETDQEAFTLLALSLGIAMLVSAGVGLLVLVAPSKIVQALNQPNLQPHLWLVPLAVLLASSYAALQMWFVRQGQFSLIARSRVAQSLGGTGTQIGGGLMSMGVPSLLLGHTMNSGVACLLLGYSLLRDANHRFALKSIQWHALCEAWRKYDRFPKFSTLEALCNNAAIHLPIILIAGLGASSEGGHLMMATYVMQAPMALIGSAIGQVYISHAAREHRDGRLGAFTEDVFLKLMKIGVGPLLAVGILAPSLFGLVFGAEWHRAGVLVAWMTPWFILQFLVSPISMALHVTQHQRLALVLQIGGLIVRLASIYIAYALANGYLSESYAISGALFYLVYLCCVFKTTSATASRPLLRSIGWVIFYVAAATLLLGISTTLQP